MSEEGVWARAGFSNSQDLAALTKAFSYEKTVAVGCAALPRQVAARAASRTSELRAEEAQRIRPFLAAGCSPQVCAQMRWGRTSNRNPNLRWHNSSHSPYVCTVLLRVSGGDIFIYR